jgi:hypothetical protein
LDGMLTGAAGGTSSAKGAGRADCDPGPITMLRQYAAFDAPLQMCAMMAYRCKSPKTWHQYCCLPSQPYTLQRVTIHVRPSPYCIVVEVCAGACAYACRHQETCRPRDCARYRQGSLSAIARVNLPRMASMAKRACTPRTGTCAGVGKAVGTRAARCAGG